MQYQPPKLAVKNTLPPFLIHSIKKARLQTAPLQFQTQQITIKVWNLNSCQWWWISQPRDTHWRCLMTGISGYLMLPYISCRTCRIVRRCLFHLILYFCIVVCLRWMWFHLRQKMQWVRAAENYLEMFKVLSWDRSIFCNSIICDHSCLTWSEVLFIILNTVELKLK